MIDPTLKKMAISVLLALRVSLDIDTARNQIQTWQLESLRHPNSPYNRSIDRQPMLAFICEYLDIDSRTVQVELPPIQSPHRLPPIQDLALLKPMACTGYLVSNAQTPEGGYECPITFEAISLDTAIKVIAPTIGTKKSNSVGIAGRLIYISPECIPGALDAIASNRLKLSTFFDEFGEQANSNYRVEVYSEGKLDAVKAFGIDAFIGHPRPATRHAWE